MTNDQIETARRAMALPGFKVMGGTLFVSGPPPGMGPPMEALRSGAPTHRVDNDAEDPLEMLQQLGWTIHLADPTGATDGVLLRLLGVKLTIYFDASGVHFARRRIAPLMPTISGATLSEACCRAALALGQWPGGMP